MAILLWCAPHVKQLFRLRLVSSMTMYARYNVMDVFALDAQSNLLLTSTCILAGLYCRSRRGKTYKAAQIVACGTRACSEARLAVLGAIAAILLAARYALRFHRRPTEAAVDRSSGLLFGRHCKQGDLSGGGFSSVNG